MKLSLSPELLKTLTVILPFLLFSANFVKASSIEAEAAFALDKYPQQLPPLLKLEKSASWSCFELNATINSIIATTTVCFNSQMTTGLDVTYDAGLLRSGSGLEIYTHLVEDNGIAFAVQCLPTEFDSLIIPVGIESNYTGNLELSANLNKIPTFWLITLEDNVEHSFTPITNDLSVTLPVQKGLKGIGRFYIHVINTLPDDNLTLGDSTLSAGTIACFDALTSIMVAWNSSVVLIEKDASVSFIAGQSVTLLPGFKAVEGSYAEVSITNDSSFCDLLRGTLVNKQGIQKDNTNISKKTGYNSSVIENIAITTGDHIISELKIYHVKGSILIDGALGENAVAYLSDITGRKFGVFKLTEGKRNTINTNALRPGFYVMRIIDGVKYYTNKIMVN